VDLMPFMMWLQSMGWATALRESALTYPTILSLHLVGMGLFGSMVAMTDFRLLGIAMRSQRVADIHGQLRGWKHLGLTLVVTCGVLLAWSKAAIYWPNPYFRGKLTLLLLVGIHALVFRPTVYSKLEEFDRAGVIPGRAKLAAVVSILLWVLLVTCGRMIGYWEPEEL
jgi:hypothetical protein